MAEPTKPLAPVTSKTSPGFDSAMSSTASYAASATSSRVLSHASSPGGVALHPARIGGGAAATARARGGGEASLAPIGVDLDDVAAALQFLHRRVRQPPLTHQDARPSGARPERAREMLRVPSWSVDRLLQIHVGMDVAHEQLGGPLILLVAAGRTPGEIRLAVTQCERRRERRARPLARSERGWMPLLQPKHLRAGAEAEAELRDDRRGGQPTAGRRRRYEVAGRIDDVEMHGIAAHLTQPADGRLARAHAADRAALAVVAPQLHHRAEAGDGSRTQFERSVLADEFSPLFVV